MIKSLMLRRIKVMPSFQKLVNRFKVHGKDAKYIGFKDNKIPNHRTFRHFENVRIDNNVLESAMDSFVITIKEELAKRGEKLGKRIGIDSTPLEALFNDEDAKYNGHYEISGYKIHGCYDLERNLPLAIIVTTAEEGDSPIFDKSLAKVHKLGIEFEEVYADGAYNSFEHFAIVHVVFDAKFYTRIDKNAVFKNNATKKKIEIEYQKFSEYPGFIPKHKTSFNYMLRFLYQYGKAEKVGAYFRNIHMMEWAEWLKDKENDIPIPFNLRNVAEGFHGFIKKHLNLQKYFHYRGFKNAERHIRWTYLSVLGIALTRVQNGITKNLTQIAYFE